MPDQRQFKTAFGTASASATLAFPVAVLSNSTIIVVVTSQFPVALVSDSQGNTYVVDAFPSITPGQFIGVFRAFTASGALTVTVQLTGTGRVIASAQEVPNILIVDQGQAGFLTGLYLQIELSGLHPQVQDVYSVGSAYSASGTAYAWTYNPPGWRMLVANPDAHGLHFAIFDRSFQWNNTTGPLLLHTNPDSNVVENILLCMVTYIERVTAEFTGTPTAGAAPLDVDFTDASTGTPTNWFWEFGDNGTAITQNPSHTYAEAGTYSVRLTASKFDSSNQRTRTNYIVVGGGGSGGGGGVPPTPGQPNNRPDALAPTPFPFPPIPGSPWASFSSPFTSPPPSAAAAGVAVGEAVLLPTGSSEGAERDRYNRILASLADGVVREKLAPRDGADTFYIIGTGFESTAAPTETDDASIGGFVGSTWVRTETDTSGNEIVTLWICFDATVDAADWRQVANNAGQGIGGATGSFPG